MIVFLRRLYQLYQYDDLTILCILGLVSKEKEKHVLVVILST